jgi:receptor expression-enhancing protein 5/6
MITGIPKDKLPKYCFISLALLVVFGIGQVFLTNVLCVVYPVCMSFSALESSNEGENRKWLSYWVIFCLINGIDYFATFLQSIPHYYVIKLATLIWLYHPKTQGAS